MEETITKFTPIEYPKVDFDPSKYTLDELSAIEHKILEEQTARRKAQEDIDLIELKTKYEHQWISLNDYPDSLYYVDSVESVYTFNCTKFTRREVNWFEERQPAYSISLKCELRGKVKDANLVDADEAGKWVADFKKEINNFIDTIGD